MTVVTIKFSVESIVTINITVPKYGILQEIKEKYDSIVNRKLYTKYKTAPTEEEKEKARQEYLNKKGIHSDFRW